MKFTAFLGFWLIFFNLKSQNIDSMLLRVNNNIDFSISYNNLVYDDSVTFVVRDVIVINDSLLHQIADYGDSAYSYLVNLLYDENKDWVVNILLYYIYRKQASHLIFYKNDLNSWRKNDKASDVKFWKENRPIIYRKK